MSHSPISPDRVNLRGDPVFRNVPAANHNTPSLNTVTMNRTSAELGPRHSQYLSGTQGSYHPWNTPHPQHGQFYVNPPPYHPQLNHPSQSNLNTPNSYLDNIPYNSVTSRQTFSTFSSHPGFDASSPNHSQWQPPIHGSSAYSAPSGSSSSEYKPVADYSTMSYEERHQISPEILLRFGRKGSISSQSSLAIPATETAMQPAPRYGVPTQPPVAERAPEQHGGILPRPTAPVPHMQPQVSVRRSSIEGHRHSMAIQPPSLPMPPVPAAVPGPTPYHIAAPFKKAGGRSEDEGRQVLFVIPPTIPKESNYHDSPASLTPIASFLTNAVARAANMAHKNGQRLRFAGTSEGLPSAPSKPDSTAAPTRRQTPPESLPAAYSIPAPEPKASKQSRRSSSGGNGRQPSSLNAQSFVQFSPYQNDREKQEIRRVDTRRLKSASFSPAVDGAPPASAPPMVPSTSSQSSSSVPIQPHPAHQTINLDGDASSSTSSPEANETLPLSGGKGKGGKAPSKKPFLACEFCRNRKIACGPGPTIPKNIELPPGPRTCNQCHRRGLVCKFPEASRRGLRHGKPSRRVIYGPENQFRIIDPEDLSDLELEWEEIVDYCDELQKSGGKKSRDKNAPKQPAREWSPINFVPAVDADILRELAIQGLIPPGGYL